jgi:tRNA threonylcarbamoyladenosine biosynthesis protein TsaB
MPDSAIAIAELDKKLSEYDEPIRLCGDGYDVTLPLLTHAVIPTSERYRHQSGYSVAQVARRMLTCGETCTDITLSPIYLRLSQAERERAERMGNIDTGI